MKHLLLIAHGSRRQQSNDEVRDLTQQLTAAAQGHFDQVSCAFLELSAPSIPEGIDSAARQGAHSIIVLPYFLAAGQHVGTEIPKIIASAHQRHPQVTITLLPHLGASKAMPSLLLSIAEDMGYR
ncbi:MAG: cobalamin biosynthesis protein CbiX [Gammaproteobacteria bacterium]|nr:cobalamin biosynthesis protein CbiX [Gammaproteobacteria bacterium]